ncbi:MAG: aerobic carbon-monoxide dehydrogenase large subunit [Actinomycetota bacterium]|nr:aerobic carbon-monoxide dehydrogenase large subunit [Actinomycetota bacterium]
MATVETAPGRPENWREVNMPEVADAPLGYGRMKRKEDARFITGRGNYLDDVRLPGMLHGALLRSPYAHAKIVSIDTSAALAHPKVARVVIAKDLEALGLAWMPTISYDTQSVLAGDKVRFQHQEVAFVVATDAYAAQDALALIDVEYEPLPAIVNARKALDADAPLIRDDKVGQQDNLASPTWEAGDRGECDRVFAEADTVVQRDLLYPRCHPSPMETCGMVADMNPETGQLNLYNGNQAPHAHRTVYAQVAGLPEHMIRIICNDIGGGFGNKVPVYPGYVCAIAASIVAGAPVKWIEDRTENLVTTGFARDYVMNAEMCSKGGKITGLRVDVIADHGAFDSTAQPTKFPAGFFHIVTGSYDLQGAHVAVKAVYTNKAPGGVAYRCSFRITEAIYCVERMVEALAMEMGVDPVELRMKSFIRPEQFPYETKTGWTYDSGDYAKTMQVAMDMAGYDELRAEQKEKIANGEIMGIGTTFFTEGVGAGPRKHMDILGLAMNDGADLRVHPSGKAVVSISSQTQGQGHETTFAQIVGEELGISPNDIQVRHGDTDKTPYGLGTYGSRSTPVSGGAVAVVARKVRDKARAFAAQMLETRPEDLAWEKGKWYVKGDPDKAATINEIAEYAYGPNPLPEGLEGGLDATAVYNPPNLTYPCGAYICVVDIDPETGEVKIRRFIAVDDCGVRINPMVVEGQIMGGLVEGVGIALMELISFDEQGNCLNSSFMDYLLPTAVECPDFELGETVTPCPHHPIGAKGVGESACNGSPPAITNAVVDGLFHAKGIKHMDMPCNPARTWAAMQGNATPPQ